MNNKISVIMGTYNCSDTIKDAINSLIQQTYKDWELIVCDDCSIDNTYAILEEFRREYPDRIILLKNKENSRLAFSLNECLKYVTGHFVARMDGDDVSAPERFEKQVRFLRENKNIDLVGTAMQRFDSGVLADIIYPVEHPTRYTLRNRMPFNHATIMTYKYVYDTLGGYTVAKRTMRAQDYDLWFRFYHNDFNGSNILEPLYYVRENESAIKRRTFSVRFNAYKTTLIGFHLLNYPIQWYIRPTILMIFKSLLPVKAVLIYRKFQHLIYESKKKNN